MRLLWGERPPLPRRHTPPPLKPRNKGFGAQKVGVFGPPGRSYQPQVIGELGVSGPGGEPEVSAAAFGVETCRDGNALQKGGLPAPVPSHEKCDRGRQPKLIQVPHSRDVEGVDIERWHATALEYDRLDELIVHHLAPDLGSNRRAPNLHSLDVASVTKKARLAEAPVYHATKVTARHGVAALRSALHPPLEGENLPVTVSVAQARYAEQRL